MTEPAQQRRGRRIAMTADELDEFLDASWVCRLASVGGDGAPHNSPLWYVWFGGAIWLSSLSASQRWANLQRDPRVSILVDGGASYSQLHGVELLGRVEIVGEVPRTGEDVPELDPVEERYARKYNDGVMSHDGRHAWLRMVPDKIVSWDFRKM
ncbi:MAG: pyridoxamine 5'-phosphate oxidase family protein [Actinomycetota bacterium]|nr:MAG: pyridoxamine 5'-phosphate oxidase family protein [Actinomycetota bacterium]